MTGPTHEHRHQHEPPPVAPAPSKVLIDKTSLFLPLSLVLGMVGGGYFVGVGITAMSNRLTAVEGGLLDLEKAIDRGTADRWRRQDMAQWAHTFMELNPDLKVPTILPD